MVERWPVESDVAGSNPVGHPRVKLGTPDVSSTKTILKPEKNF